MRRTTFLLALLGTGIYIGSQLLGLRPAPRDATFTAKFGWVLEEFHAPPGRYYIGYLETRPGEYHLWAELGRYSHCGRCGRSWAYVDARTVYIKGGRGMFAICKQCWDETTREERLAFYLDLYEEWEYRTFSKQELIEAVNEGRDDSYYWKEHGLTEEEKP